MLKARLTRSLRAESWKLSQPRWLRRRINSLRRSRRRVTGGSFGDELFDVLAVQAGFKAHREAGERSLVEVLVTNFSTYLPIRSASRSTASPTLRSRKAVTS